MEICRLANCEAADGAVCFNFLYDEQFLLLTERSKITGTGYLEKLLKLVSLAEKDSERSCTLCKLIRNSRHSLAITPEYLKDFNAKLSALFPAPSALKTAT